MMRMKASRQQGPKASRLGGSTTRRRGITLIEVLMAMFILGIGVISISALFPAGIIQHQRSTDDVIGPIVAENAMAVLRSKLKPEYFGAPDTANQNSPLFESSFLNGIYASSSTVRRIARPTLKGDWEWRRPVLITADRDITDPNTGVEMFVTGGSISIFHSQADSTLPDTSNYDHLRIPWNSVLFPDGFEVDDDDFDHVPLTIITQQERYYPQAIGNENARPQYVWDCMFRRYQGQVLVAIFVYRVTSQGGPSGVPYRVVLRPESKNLNDNSITNRPAIPIRLAIHQDSIQHSLPYGAWDATMGGFNTTPLLGADAGDDYTPFDNDGVDDFEVWQLPGQILLDQNNTIHRVLSGREDLADGPLELRRPVQALAGNPYAAWNGPRPSPDPDAWDPTEWPLFYYGVPINPIENPGVVQDFGVVSEGVVTDLWYLPDEVEIDIDGDNVPEAIYSLTPIYVTVREL
ncbi:MAG: prepilin-type N-terminal cleavage/methylation domain-containing protein [Planctomycetota bacterium]|nr:prepilin-type N-terminal cleavage/methylation domain-containing protein [Planctomycetota bacterium]